MLRSNGMSSRPGARSSSSSRPRTRPGRSAKASVSASSLPGRSRKARPSSWTARACSTPSARVRAAAGAARRDAGAAQDDLDPGHQLVALERLGQVIVGPDLEAGDPVDRLAERAQHDDAEIAAAAAQVAGERQAVPVRQRQVEHHQVGGPDGKEPVQGRGVGGCPHRVAGALEDVRDQLAHRAVVFNNDQVRQPTPPLAARDRTRQP